MTICAKALWLLHKSPTLPIHPSQRIIRALRGYLLILGYCVNSYLALYSLEDAGSSVCLSFFGWTFTYVHFYILPYGMTQPPKT